MENKYMTVLHVEDGTTKIRAKVISETSTEVSVEYRYQGVTWGLTMPKPSGESQPDGFLEWLDEKIEFCEPRAKGEKIQNGTSGSYWTGQINLLRLIRDKYLSLHAQPNPEPSVASIRKDANKVMGQIRKRADLEYQKSMNNNPHGMGVAEGIDWCMRMMDTVPFLFRDKEGFTVLPPAVQQEDGEQEDMTDQQVIEMLKDANASLQSQLYTSLERP